MTVPYVTPAMLSSYPHGLDLTSIPFPNASPDQQAAELTNVCNRATAEVIGTCQQELRATINTDTEQGPDWKITINSQGIAEFRLIRFPVLQLLSGQVASARIFPRTWTQIPLNCLALKNSIPGEYGTVAPDPAAIGPDTVLIAPTYVNWANGRGGYTVQVTYINGWPHCGVVSNVAIGDTHLTVDDTTGWIGVTGTIYDGAETESFLVTSISAQSGPGVLTLATPALNTHVASAKVPVIFSSLPAQVQTATFYYCIEQLLVRGATATTVPSLPGAEVHTGRDSGDLKTEAEILLQSFVAGSW